MKDNFDETDIEWKGKKYRMDFNLPCNKCCFFQDDELCLASEKVLGKCITTDKTKGVFIEILKEQ